MDVLSVLNLKQVLSSSSELALVIHGTSEVAFRDMSTVYVKDVTIDTPSFLTSIVQIPSTGVRNINISLASQSVNTVFAAPTVSGGTPSFQLLQQSHIPNLDISKIIDLQTTLNSKLTLSSVLTGFTVGANTAITAADTILSAFVKTQEQINAINSAIPSPQTLSFTNPGVLSISGGNSVNLLSLYSLNYTDFSTYQTAPGLYSITNGSGSTGFPTTTGAGLLVQRGAASSNGRFALWTAANTTEALYYNIGDNGWKIIADRDYVTGNFYQNLDVNIPNKAGDYRVFPWKGTTEALDFDLITGSGFYKNMAGTGATNGPKSGFWYVENLKYSTGDGNTTQIAWPYRTSDGLHFRTRGIGVWTPWTTIWHATNALVTTSPTTNQLLQFNGTNWVNWTPTFAPASGSTNYIQNQNSSAQSANGWISGTFSAGSIVIGRAATGDSNLLVGYGRTVNGNGGIYMYTDGSAGTNITSFVQRNTGADGVLNIGNYGTGDFLIRQYGVASIKLQTNSSNRLVIFGNGNVNIGSPSDNGLALLQVTGAIYTSSIANGALVKSVSGVLSAASASDITNLVSGSFVTTSGNQSSLSGTKDWTSAHSWTIGSLKYSMESFSQRITYSGSGGWARSFEVKHLNSPTAVELGAVGDIDTVNYGYFTVGGYSSAYGIRVYNAANPTVGPSNLIHHAGNFATLKPDLEAIEVLSGTSGLLRKTAANTWTLDTNTYLVAADLSGYATQSWVTSQNYLTGNESITLSGDVTGTGTTTITTTITNKAVTFAKIQDITSARLLGRYSTGSGVVQELFLGAGFSLNTSTGEIIATGTGGTVTTFSAGNLSPLFTTSVDTETTTPSLTFTLSTQNAKAVFIGPVNGSPAAPTFRELVASDLPTHTHVKADITDLAVFTTDETGLVPARVGATTTRFLREDGTWVVPTNTTYSVVTLAALNAGTETTTRAVSALRLNEWLSVKPFWGITSTQITNWDTAVTKVPIWTEITSKPNDGSFVFNQSLSPQSAASFWISSSGSVGGGMNVGRDSDAGDKYLAIGRNRVANGTVGIQFISSTVNATTNDAYIMKVSGANGHFYIQNKGTGNLDIIQENAGPIRFFTQYGLRGQINSLGRWIIGPDVDTTLALLQVQGAIQQTSVTNSILKANSSGVLVAAIASDITSLVAGSYVWQNINSSGSAPEIANLASLNPGYYITQLNTGGSSNLPTGFDGGALISALANNQYGAQILVGRNGNLLTRGIVLNVATSWILQASQTWVTSNFVTMSTDQTTGLTGNKVWNGTHQFLGTVTRIGDNGTLPPGFKLYVNSGSSTGSGIYIYGRIVASEDAEAASDIKLKTDLKAIANPIEKILKISGYDYLRKDDLKGRRRGGHVANEVMEILPYAVTLRGNTLTLQDRPILALHTEAIKEVINRQETLKEKVKRLEERVKELEDASTNG